MAKSLQEQLLGAGLVDKKKAKAIKQEQRKQKKQQPKGLVQEDENKKRLEQERLDKIERDRQLNMKLKAQAEEKAIAAQIRQLVQSNQITPEQDNVGYQFADGTKIRKIYVSEKVQNQLSKGLAAIARLDENYYVVPNKVADKIAQRDASYIIALKIEESGVAEDDPYADYKIPDDLMW